MSNTINIAGILAAKWAQDQEKEAQYHIHPEGEEGASNLGGCIGDRAMEEAGIYAPAKQGAAADWGAAYVGSVGHDKIQSDLVPELQRLYPQYVVGPVLEPGKPPQEIVIKIEILPGKYVLSPLDICMVTQPGFVKEIVQYKNVPKEVYVKHPDARFVLGGDIKFAAPFSYSIHEEEGIGEEYEGQMLPYLKAMNLPSMFVLFVNKLNYHRFTVVVEYTEEKWVALQAKRQREMEIAAKLQEGHPVDWKESDFKYTSGRPEYICAYCRRSKSHDVSLSGMEKVVLDEPCEQVVELVAHVFEGKFLPGSHWMSGQSMLLVEKVEGGKVYSHNKGGKAFEDTVFHAAKTYTEGWEKKPRDEEKKPRTIHPSVLLPVLIYDAAQQPPLTYEEYGNPENICMHCGAPGASSATGECKKCDDADDLRDAAANKEAAEREKVVIKPASKLLPPDPEDVDIVLPQRETDEEAMANINALGSTCTLCTNPRMEGQNVCAEHYRKIGEAIKNI
jgi:ribosomal protein L40E